MATTIWPTSTSGLLGDGFNGDQIFKTFVIVGIVILVVGLILAILFPKMRGNSTKKKRSSIFNDKNKHNRFHNRDSDHDGTPDWRDDDPHDPFDS